MVRSSRLCHSSVVTVTNRYSKLKRYLTIPNRYSKLKCYLTIPNRYSKLKHYLTLTNRYSQLKRYLTITESYCKLRFHNNPYRKLKRYLTIAIINSNVTEQKINRQQIAYAFDWDIFIKPVYILMTSRHTTLKTK